MVYRCASGSFFAVALLVAAGCQGGGGPAASGIPAASQTGEFSQTCLPACNAQYDACMDRASGRSSGSALGGHLDSTTGALGTNDVCPEQLKSCIRRCPS